MGSPQHPPLLHPHSYFQVPNLRRGHNTPPFVKFKDLRLSGSFISWNATLLGELSFVLSKPVVSWVWLAEYIAPGSPEKKWLFSFWKRKFSKGKKNELASPTQVCAVLFLPLCLSVCLRLFTQQQDVLLLPLLWLQTSLETLCLLRCSLFKGTDTYFSQKNH